MAWPPDCVFRRRPLRSRGLAVLPPETTLLNGLVDIFTLLVVTVDHYNRPSPN
jgi:hypothetical protein